MDREISIQVPAFDSFIKEYSANVSTTGMFIKSEKPLAPETEFAFEFRIADDWKLIRGEAKVVWCRHRDEGPDQPAGMGVQFSDLEPQSRRLIGWIIEKHVREGGKPFDLDRLQGVPDEHLEAPKQRASPAVGAATPPAKPPRPAPRRAARVASAGPRFPLLSLLLAGLAVALLLAGLFWLSERSAQSVADPELPPDVTSTEEPPPTAGESESAASDDSVAPPAVPVFLEAARRLVDSWSQAWSAQDVDAYLSHYAQDFEPPRGMSRSAWAEDRRRRLTRPEFIRISITGLEAEVESESRGRVTFTQGYRSNTYEDSVRKTLELVREDGRWKILAEASNG